MRLEKAQSVITWLYDVDKHGATIRAPIDLDTHTIDWLRVEPWQEPPLLSRVRTRCRKCHDERGCKHTRMKASRGDGAF